MTLSPIVGAALEAAVSKLENWEVKDGKLVRRFRFADGFSAAFAFMTRVAMVAETNNHHPEWSNVYDRVEIRLTTHDVANGSITEQDLELARAIDRIAGTPSDRNN